MTEKIKLIWDFRGQSATQTAQHHEIHLKEYIRSENLSENTTGFEKLSDFHAVAYMVVAKNEMILVRDALKPHRGEIYS